MPTSTPTTPPAAAPQNPPGGFFIPQKTTTTTNLSESPVLSSPAIKNTPPVTPNVGLKPSSSRNKILLGLSVVVVILVLIGVGAGLYLTQTNVDNRQQASTSSGSAKLTVSPDSGTFKGNTEQQVNFSLDLTSTPITLSDIELSISFAGKIPSDLQFFPQQLQNFLPADISITDSDTGKLLIISFKPSGTQGFSATSTNISLGVLKFTSPDSGQLNLRFNASDSKVLLQQSNLDILRPPSLVSYSFESSLTPSTLLENDLTNLASSSGNEVATNSATPTQSPTPTLSGIGGAIPTNTPTLLAQINTTTTPTNTPTKTPSLTPTPTDVRESSLPANTQDTPVSGSAGLTVTLFGSGLLFILTGFYLIPKKKALRSDH
ncbi:MAG: hypothetical protein ABI425_02805 [Patescibacteria group bacterium]